MTESDLIGSCAATSAKSPDHEASEQHQLSQIPAAFLFGNIDASGNIEEDDGEDHSDDDENDERHQREESGARRGYLFDSATRKAFSSGGLDQILGSDRALSDLIAVDPPPVHKSEDQKGTKSDDSEDFDETSDGIEDITGNQVKSSALNPIIPSQTAESPILKCVVRFLNHLLDRIFDSNCPSPKYEPFKPQIDIEKILFDQEKIKQTAKQHNRDSIFKPLENLLPPFYSEMNMTDIFPFFVDNKPLRFFKLFSSIYHQEYFPKYHNFSVPEAITLNYYLNQKEYVDTFKSNFLSSTNKSGREDHLPRGRRDLNSNFLYRFKQHGSKNLSDWIEGPAALWYKNQNFSLSGFTVNEMESLSAPSIALGQEDFELTQSYKSWRDNIIFDSNSPAALEKQENRDELERRQSMAGWVLGPNCHSYAEYCANSNLH